jgi:two-component system response regulator HydG
VKRSPGSLQGVSLPSLVLTVVRGPGEGARMTVDATARIVGRGRDADLVVLDARVSRRHLRVTAVDGGAWVEVLAGAEPALIAGVQRYEALLRAGESIVVGDTALALAADAQEPADPAAARTDVRLLMTGLAADVRGLTAAMELIDELDASGNEAGITAALRTWGRRHAGALDVALASPSDEEAHETCLVETPGPAQATVLVSAPAPCGNQVARVIFTCATGEGQLTDTTRRLVAVAARLAGSALFRTRALERADEERELFRRVSLGSARSFLGDSPAARELSKLVTRLAASETIVLIEGETGVGKTFLARLLHESSARSKEPLRIINCAAIPESLIESELFGHERGAFTGASTARVGALESAGRGTVLLDEIGELPLASQAKLLRVLEEKRFERLGSNRAVRLEARILTATNRDLAHEVEEGTFRRDLYYRIAVVKLRVPPLRDRGEDLLLLAAQVLADLAPSAGRRVEGFSPSALDAIVRYPWPGNVRELRNAIERALVVGDGAAIEARDFPEIIHGATPPQPEDESLVRLPMRLDRLEARGIKAALWATGGNQRRAAALLGIGRVTLHRKLRAKDVEEKEPEQDRERAVAGERLAFEGGRTRRPVAQRA